MANDQAMIPSAHTLGMAMALLVVLASAGRAVGEEAAGTPAVVSPTPVPADTGRAVGSVQPGAPRTGRRRRGDSPEERLQKLVKGLKLDPTQQTAVRYALEAQREEIRRMALSPDPGGSRVDELRAINHRTAERIRAVLTDEQKKLFGQAMPIEAGSGEGKRSLEEWLEILRTRKNLEDT